MSVTSILNKSLFAMLIAAILLNLFACGSNRQSAEVSPDGSIFPDPDVNLEAAVRDALDKPTGQVQTSDLETLQTLIASDKAITDITGLEQCRNLERLILSRNIIEDISPLASLTNLTELRLEGTI